MIQDYLQSALTLDAIFQFPYLGSTVTSNLLLDAEINMCIVKAVYVMSKLDKIMMQHRLDRNTKLRLPDMCPLHTYLAVKSEQHTQDKRLTSFNIRCLQRILGIYPGCRRSQTQRFWNVIQAPTCLCHCHAHRIANGVPKDIMCGELVTGTRTMANHVSVIQTPTSAR